MNDLRIILIVDLLVGQSFKILDLLFEIGQHFVAGGMIGGCVFGIFVVVDGGVGALVKGGE